MKKITKILMSATLLLVMAIILVDNNTKALDSETEVTTEEVFESATPTRTRGVGETIANTFPDPQFAQAIADKIASGDVEAVITQSMIDPVTHISFANAGIKDITNIDVFVNLEILDLNNNEISIIPDSIGDLSKLEIIIFNSNKISSLPDSIVNLTKLRQLYVTSNQLISLPDNIGNMSSLLNITATNNQLASLPDSIGNLTKLLILDLNGNNLSALPDSMGNLINLVLLNVEYNQLTSLPDSMSNLAGLQIVGLQYNLLPTDYHTKLNTLGLSYNFTSTTQSKLTLKSGITPYTIKNSTDLSSIDLASTVFVNGFETQDIFSRHILQLENYQDQNGNAINMNDFIKNGIVQKDAVIFAQVRATGRGLFPNNSDNAITAELIQLNLIAPRYALSFDLNGSNDIAPSPQILAENEIGTTVENPTRDGYTFKGWNTVANGTGTVWIPGTTPMLASDTIIYAQWENESVIVNPVVEPTTPTLPKTGLLNTSLIFIIFTAICVLFRTKVISLLKK